MVVSFAIQLQAYYDAISVTNFVHTINSIF